MNPIRRVEIGCGVALALAAVAVLLHAAPDTTSTEADGAQASMPVVVITGKRMTGPEKRQAAEAEAAAKDSGSGA